MTYTRTYPASRPPRQPTPGTGETIGQYDAVFTGYFAGDLTTSTGTGNFPVVLGVPWTLTGVSISMKTTADQDVIASAYNQGAAVYASGNRPTISSGNVRSGLATSFISTALQDFTSTQAFSMKLDQVGTSTATGSYLAAVVHYRAKAEDVASPLAPATIAAAASVVGALDDNYLYGQSDGVGGVSGALIDNYLYGASTGTGGVEATL